MEDQFEIELKFEILDKTGFQGFIKDLEQVSESSYLDIYFDTKDARLYKKGIFIRVRDQKRLDFKFSSHALENPDEFDDHSSCEEYNFDLPLTENDLPKLNTALKILNLKEISNPTVEDLKEQNNFVDSIVIDKLRKEYKLGKFLIVHDVIKDLGEYVEIEFIGSPEETKKIKQEMNETLKGLNLKLMTVGYNEIYWRKNGFNTYLQGRFLLQEDYAKYRPEMLKSKQD